MYCMTGKEGKPSLGDNKRNESHARGERERTKCLAPKHDNTVYGNPAQARDVHGFRQLCTPTALTLAATAPPHARRQREQLRGRLPRTRADNDANHSARRCCIQGQG